MKKSIALIVAGVILSLGLVVFLLGLRMPLLHIAVAFFGLLVISVIGLFPRLKGMAGSGLSASDLKSFGRVLYVSAALLFLVDLISMMRTLESPEYIGRALAIGFLPACLAVMLERLVLVPWRFRLVAHKPDGITAAAGAGPAAAGFRGKPGFLFMAVVNLLILLAVLLLYMRWPLKAFLTFAEYRSLLLVLLLPLPLLGFTAGPGSLLRVYRILQSGPQKAASQAELAYARHWTALLNGSFLTVALVGGSCGLVDLVGNINDLHIVGPALHFALSSVVYALIAYISIGLPLNLLLSGKSAGLTDSVQ